MSETEEQDKKRHTAIPEAAFLGQGITRLGSIFAIAIVFSAGALIFEVVMRYGFNSPTQWAHETVIFLTAITFVYGGLYGASTDRHIRVVLVYENLSPRLRRAFDITISLACAFATALFSWAGWLVVQKAIWTPAGDFRFETSGSAWNPPFPGLLKVFLFLILIIMSIQFAILAINYARKK